jgi:hypothetical protein
MQLHFIPSKNPKFPAPVSKYDGKLAVIDSKSKNATIVKEGEAWDCELVKDMTTFVIVNPLNIAVKEEKRRNNYGR